MGVQTVHMVRSEKSTDRLLVIALFLLTFSLQFSVYALEEKRVDKVYYVSKKGNDNWSGKRPKPNSNGSDGPFLTIKKALEVMKDGGICYIRKGTYRETVFPNFVGEPSRKLRLVGYKNEKVIINGCSVMDKGWTKISEHIFSVPLEKTSEDLIVFHNENWTPEARWPNYSGDLLKPNFAKVDGGTALSLQNTDLPKNIDLKGATLYGFFGKEWALQTFVVSGYKPNEQRISFPEAKRRQNYYGGTSGWDKNYAPRKGNRFYISGHYDLLDTDGEWYYDPQKGKLFFYLEEHEASSELSLEIKTRNNAIDLSGSSYVEIANLDIFGAGITSDALTQHCLIENVKGFYVEPGINLSGKHNEINSCEFAYSPKALVNITGSNNKVVNSYIHDGNYTGTWDQLLNTSGSGHLISHNTVARAGGGCIGPGGKNMRFQYNSVSDAGLIRHDIGGFYVANNDGAGTVIHHNKVHNVYGIGIYLDNSTSNYTIHHNVVWNCGWEYILTEAPPGFLSIGAYDGIRLNTPGNYNLIFNNTLYNKYGLGYWGRNFKEDMYGDVVINNIFTGSYHVSENVVTTHNLFKDIEARLVDPQSQNFELSATSPAIDKGVILKSITDSFEGQAPDLGAFEYGKEAWRAGHNFDAPPKPEFEAFKTDFMNLVTNGTFEQGLNAWHKTGEAVQIIQEDSWGIETAKTRMQSHSVAIHKKNNGIQQTIENLESNTNYTMSVWVKAPDSGAKGELRIESKDSKMSGQTSLTSEWEFLSIEFKTDDRPKPFTVSLLNTGSQATVYFDDVGLVKNIGQTINN
ncbi:carbohydrate binding domain-containing protein [Zobellia galactanivorans]|nr:carbohydrate binding domain-containing protein [Zobellia galactanivorans]